MPALVTNVFPGVTDHFNGQAFLDGNDTHWITSVHVGELRGEAALPFAQFGQPREIRRRSAELKLRDWNRDTHCGTSVESSARV